MSLPHVPQYISMVTDIKSTAEPDISNGPIMVLELLLDGAPVTPVTRSDCNGNAHTHWHENPQLLLLAVAAILYAQTVQQTMADDATLIHTPYSPMASTRILKPAWSCVWWYH